MPPNLLWWVQSTLFNVWVQAKAPSWLPHLKEYRGPKERCLHQMCRWIHSHCLRLIEATLQDAQAKSMAEAWRQKQYYNQKIGAVGLKPGNLILVKADTLQEKMKIKDRWEDKPHKMVHQITTDIPSYEVKDQHGHSHVLHCKWLLLIVSEAGIPLCVGVCQVWDRCTSPAQSSLLPEGVTARLCHKKMMVWQSPNIRLGRLPLGGSMGSYGFICGCQLEHPLRMGEDSR